MTAKKVAKAINPAGFVVPLIKEGQKVKGIVLKKISNGVLVDCSNAAFTGIILSKEVKELERSGYDLAP
jgi:ribosomal protein S1